jgi:hypothetical protein
MLHGYWVTAGPGLACFGFPLPAFLTVSAT